MKPPTRRLEVPTRPLFRGGFDSMLRAWWRNFYKDDTPEVCQRETPTAVVARPSMPHQFLHPSDLADSRFI